MTTHAEIAATFDLPAKPELPDYAVGATDQNPTDIGLFRLLIEDWQTYDRDFFEQGLWAVIVHRFGNWRMNIRPKLIRLPFSLLYKFLYRLVECLGGISLPYNVRLGRRVRIWHHGGIILSAESIGNDVQIRQNTTLGVRRTVHNFELPRIGDSVDIGAHVCILGGVTIGENSVIGAGAVVLIDVPPHGVAAGVPAKIVKVMSHEE